MMQGYMTQRICMSVDRIFSNVALFVLIVAAACSAKESTAKKDDMSDDEALDALPPKKDSMVSVPVSGSVTAQSPSKARAKYIVSTLKKGAEKVRIIRNERQEQFAVAMSLENDVSRTFHVSDLMVGAFYGELFACKRLHKKVDVPCNYQVHFKVTEKQKVTYDSISPGLLCPKGTQTSFKNAPVTKCLAALYENAVIEFSTPVPFEQFVLTFDLN